MALRHLRAEEKQNGGNQRARVADTDPEHEVDDAESPRHGSVVAPRADTVVQRPGDAETSDAKRGQRHGQGDIPSARRPPVGKLQHLIVRDPGETVPSISSRGCKAAGNSAAANFILHLAWTGS